MNPSRSTLIIGGLLLFFVAFSIFSSGGIPVAQQGAAIYRSQPSLALSCSMAREIDPSGPSFQLNPQIEGKYVIWTETYSVGGPTKLVYYDLGPDERFGTMDDGGKFSVMSSASYNENPQVHNGILMWVGGSGGIFDSIYQCTLPQCASSPSSVILASTNELFRRADFSGSLVAYIESPQANLGVYSLHLYDSVSGSNTVIYNQPSAAITDLSIDKNFVVFSAVISSSGGDIYAYDRTTGSLLQVTNTPDPNTPGEIQPHLSYLSTGKSLLSYNKKSLSPAGGLQSELYVSQLTSGSGVQQLLSINFANHGGGNIRVGPIGSTIPLTTPYIHHIPPNPSVQYLRKQSLPYSQYQKIRVPSPYPIQGAGDVWGNNVVTMAFSSSSGPYRVLISRCAS